MTQQQQQQHQHHHHSPYLALAVEVDAHNVLVDDPPGADVQVAHLGVAHQAGGQADRQAAGVQRQVVALLGAAVLRELIHDGRFRVGNRIAVHLLGDAPAVDDDQTDGLLRSGCHDFWEGVWWR